jgi:quinol monooxygenase YgiN
LSRNSADPDSGFAVSMWANMTDLQDYEQSEAYKNISGRLQPFFIGEYNTYRSEIRYTENL